MSWLDGRTDKAQLESLTKRMHALEESHKELVSAFDALFDAVAEDLGYEAVQRFSWHLPHMSLPVSPRTLAETVKPEQRTIKRSATARCAKRGKRG